MRAAMIPVTTKTTTIEARIFPKRFKSVILAIVEAIEKNTSGTTVVNSRLRKMSPRGLRTAACSFEFLSMLGGLDVRFVKSPKRQAPLRYFTSSSPTKTPPGAC